MGVNGSHSPLHRREFLKKDSKLISTESPTSTEIDKKQHFSRAPEIVRQERRSFEAKEKPVDILPVLSKSAKIGARPAASKRPSLLSPAKTVYKYKHVPGNNTRVILYNFRKRPW